MYDLISKTAAINTTFNMCCRWDGEDRDDLRNMMLTAFQELPTIDPVKHGKWIKIGAAKYRCGECGKVQYGDRGSDLHFCCNCGTKNMEGWEYV